MKIIFLDIDGVIIPMNPSSLVGSMYLMPDPECIKHLWQIIEQTNAYIVISSSWRHNMEECRDLLQKYGCYKERDLWERVIGKTPKETGGGRSTEILLWLDEYHKNCEDGKHITHWVAIDDEYFDMKAIKRMGKLCITEPHVGIAEDDMGQAIAILNS